MATNLQSGSPTERACAGGYTKRIVRYEGGTQSGNYLRVFGVCGDDYAAVSVPFATKAAEYSWYRPGLRVAAVDYATAVAGFQRYTVWLPAVAYNESQCSGGYTKSIIRLALAGGALDFLANPLTSTASLPDAGLQFGSSVNAGLSSVGTIPDVTLRLGLTLQPEPLGGFSQIPALAITAACTVPIAALSSTTTIPAANIAVPVLIAGVQLRSVSTIPVCSGIGIKPAPRGTIVGSPPAHGSSVSFKDFTLGWAELHRFMGVNEQPTAMPSMALDSDDHAWTGGQYVGPCIPGMGTADLATAWETSENGARGNYAY